MKFSKKDKKLIIEYYKDFAKGIKYAESVDGFLLQKKLNFNFMPQINVKPNYISDLFFNKIYPIITKIKNDIPNIEDEDLYGYDGLVSKLVPFQLAYNEVKNNKLTALNFNLYRPLCVEDGSVDIDALENEGLIPGKVVVYRSGAKQPSTIEPVQYSIDIWDNEESRLINDIDDIVESFRTEMSIKYKINKTATIGFQG